MSEMVFKTIFVVLLSFTIVIRGSIIIKYWKNGKKTISKSSGLEKMMARLSILGMVVIPLIHVFTKWLNSCNLIIPLWARMVGAGGFAVTIFLYGWTHKALGRYWSDALEIKEGHTLITEGPYRYVRHPMYSMFWIWVVFQGLLLANAAVWVVGIAIWSITYFTRINHEEEMMMEQFGDQYKDYMKRTGRLFPKIFFK